jgi:hypothetical protein
VTSSKAIFSGMAGAAPSPSAENLHVALLPADHQTPPLDELRLAGIAEYFQPRLLRYRLDQAHNVKKSKFAAADLKFPTRELACKLGACVQGDTDLALHVVPLLQEQNEVCGECNLDYAIVEVLWPRLHSPPKSRAPQMKIEAELTAEVNTYLLSCGETRQYSREEIGIRVASLEFATKRTRGGTVLLLCYETNRRVHQLARGYGIGKIVPECPHCRPVQPAPG